jgi:hypothetical protein
VSHDTHSHFTLDLTDNFISDKLHLDEVVERSLIGAWEPETNL